MAFFKFRKAGDDAATTAAQPESVEVLRRRARHRLIGAAVLVLVGVIGFPLLFDTQPRPIQVDIPIDIPDRTKAKPLAMPAAPATGPAAGAVASGAVSAPPAAAVPAPSVAPSVAPSATPKAAVTPAPKVAATETLSPREEVVPDKPKTTAATVPPAQTAIKNEAKPDPRATAKVDDGARAKALLEGKVPAPAAAAAVTAASAPPAAGRFVVQVGAFSDAAKAREARLKVERAGLKTYTQEAETKDGKRIRVRVGPFGTRAEADRAADRIKGLDLPAAILTL